MVGGFRVKAKQAGAQQGIQGVNHTPKLKHGAGFVESRFRPTLPLSLALAP
jgi:hypothetical protein